MAAAGIRVRLVGAPGATPGPAEPYRGQRFQELRGRCLERRELFTDPLFDAQPSALGYHKLGPHTRKAQGVQWKRPQEICKKPTFIQDGMSRTDVCQGDLANCWFLAAAASLTLRPCLLQRVVPPGQGFAPGQYAGIFHFQFWQYGQWVDVVVDDRLPVRDGSLLFVRSAQIGEFWMPLLEKAYAKLNGSYEAISYGYMNEAFVDFTGGIGETLLLKTPNPDLYSTMQAALRRRSLLGANIRITQDREGKTPEGLVKGHAYSVTGTHQFDLQGRQVKLVRLRNPWGNVEWNGHWSDSSPLWAWLDPQLRQTLTVKKEDGEFWMQMSDFRRCFDMLEICSLSPEALSRQEKEEGGGWSSQTLHGRWVAGSSAGGHRSNHGTYWMNPQFHVALEEPDAAEGGGPGPTPTCTLLVSLSQCGRREAQRQGQGFLPISLEILKVTEEYLVARSLARRRDLLPRLPVVAAEPYACRRDVVLHCCLPPGHYLVVPSTLHPLQEAAFVLRFFAEHTPTAQEIGEEIWEDARPLKVFPNVDTFQQTFLQLAGPDQEVDAARLQEILNRIVTNQPHVQANGFSLESCQKIVQHFDRRGWGRLALPDFRDLWSRIKEWEAVFTRFDEDGSGTMNIHEMRLALEAAGFHLNRELNEAVTGKYRDRGLQLDFDGFISCLVQLEAIFRLCKERDCNKDGVVTMTQQEWLALVART